MNTSLATFQSRFMQALLDPDIDAGQAAFAVYRNTWTGGCIEALAANFPSVVRLVGIDWFRAAATRHVRASPPDDPRLLLYGRSFPDFLASFEPARELPYLPHVARLDRLWIESHVAADATPVDTAWLAALAPEALGETRLAPHPATRWRGFAGMPIHTIWSRQRAGESMDDPLPWRGEASLLTRPADAVTWQLVDDGAVAFLDACAAGNSLSEAAEAAFAAQPETDIAALLGGLLSAGALTLAHPD
jgi:hypothetical protein